MEYRVNHLATYLLTTKLLPVDLLSTNLLPKIHQLVGQPMVLESGIDLVLLKLGNLMILLEHLQKDLLPKPSTISVHWHRPCR